MSYVFSVNTTRTTGPTMLYRFKQLMKSAGWTVPRSGDGTTYFSSSDGITSGNTGAGGLANNNAWFVLQMPLANSVNRQFMFQMTSYGGLGSSTNGTIKYSYSAGFTGGSPSGSTPATATDGYTILNNTSLMPTDRQFRMVVGADNAAPYGFYMGTYTSGGGDTSFIQSAMLMDPLLAGTYDPLDIDPYVIYFDGTAGFSLSSLNNNKTFTWLLKGLPGEGFVNMSAIPYQVGSQNMFPGSPGLGYNSITGLEDYAAIMWARNQLSTAPTGFKGIGTLARWTSIPHYSSDTYSISTTNDYIVLGHVFLPFNGGLIQK